MPQLTARRLRLKCSADKFDAPFDVLNNNSIPRGWNGSTLRMELGLFFNAEVVDVANLESLTVQLKASAGSWAAPLPTAAALASATITDFDNTLDAATWDDTSKQHCVVEFSATEMNIGAGQRWIVVTAINDEGATITICAGKFEVLEDGYGPEVTTTGTETLAYSQAESDARYLQQAGLNTAALITGYTGGGSTKLDGLETVNLAAGYLLVFVHPTGGLKGFQLQAGTDAEASPSIIRPDDYNASTNAKIWKAVL